MAAGRDEILARSAGDAVRSAPQEVLVECLREVEKDLRVAIKCGSELGRREEMKLFDVVKAAAQAAAAQAKAALESWRHSTMGEAIADTITLCAAMERELLEQAVLDDYEAAIAECQRSGAPKKKTAQLEQLGGALDRLKSRMEEVSVALAECAREAGSQPKERPIMTASDNCTADAVRDVGVTLASMLGGAALASRSSPRQPSTVAARLDATIQQLGLPREGLHAEGPGGPSPARDKLIEALTRHFGLHEERGIRAFRRVAALPVSRGPIEQSRLLRGSALVNANLLRAEADALLAILDRLPSMTRFQPAASARAEWDEGRRLLREQIDELVETARDPMGVNRLRATFQFDRVVLGIFSHLDQAEIVPQGLHVPLKACGPSLPKLQGALLRVRDEQLCVPSSVVRDEEVRAELVALVNLLVSISDRLASSDQGQQRGRAAARLEELMTALVDSVDRLELDLDRTGTDLREQNLHFAGQGDDAGRAPLSIGQFVRWLRAIAVPFADAGHRAASLGPDEAELLARELESLAEVARGFQERTKMFGLRRSAPAQQFAEIAVYLDEASREADGLAGRNVQSAA